jgi:hypothetical protein
MLLQNALPKFYDKEDHGSTPDTATVSALKRLTKEYRAELDGLGVEVRDPLTAKAPPGQPAPAGAGAADGGASTATAAPATDEVMLEVQRGDNAAAPPLPPGPAVRPGQPQTPPVSAADDEPVHTIATSEPDSASPAEAPQVADEAVAPPAPGFSPAPAPSATPPAPRPAPPPAAAQVRTSPPPVAGAAAAGSGAPSEERDLNLLLSRRNEQLGTVALGVEHTDTMPEYAVQDQQLGPVRPYHEELPVDVKTFGDLRSQAYWRDTRQPGGGDAAAGLRLYWGDAGVNFEHEQWKARVTVNYNDTTRTLKLHELWAQYTGSGGAYARAGRVILPFADRGGDFPTFSAARQLGFTSANGAGLGWNKPDWGASFWVYDPGDSAGSGGTNLREFALNLKLFHADCEDDSDGWRIALAYLSNLEGAEQRRAGGPLTRATPGLNLAAGFDWGAGRYHVNLDYAGATRRYAAADLDANGDGRGDQPQATSLELQYTPDAQQLYGLRFEHTSGYTGAAANRWAAMYGRWLSDQLLARLELSRGQYNDYTPGKRHDLGLTADVRLVF